MRPTFSIIAFTVLSGAGYGLLFLLGLAIAFGALPAFPGLPPEAFAKFSMSSAIVATPATALMIALVFGALLATAGLVCSLAHLGKPLRAWRALSQWRSSWLSREGVASLVTYLPLLALLSLLLGLWHAHFATSVLLALRITGALLCACAVATIACTANIYASLKTIRAWHDRHVLPGYLYLALNTGALWFAALATLGLPALNSAFSIWLGNALILAPCAAFYKRAYWRSIDASVSPDTGAATGLGAFGHVRSVEHPHTEQNYLTHEMGFVLARTHARRLRAIAFSSILLAPIGSLGLAFAIGWPAAWIGLGVGMAGVFVERWLFFAQARHAVMAYYAR